MTLFRFASLTALLSLAACAPSGGPAATAETPSPPMDAVRAAADAITVQEIVDDIAFLADDALLGRDTPSPGLERAAEYIADAFREVGLEPAGDDGTYLQRYPYQRTAMVAAQRKVAFRGTGAEERVFRFGRDYWILPSPQTAEAAGAVWGGAAAAPAPDLAERAFGKVAFFTTNGNPVAGTGEELLNAFQAAGASGAVAVALVLDRTQTADSIFDWASGVAGAGLATPLPILGISREAATEIVHSAGMNMATLLGGANATDLDGVTVSVAAPIEVSDHTPPNVVGVLPGSDPELRDEYVVYTAHFDHVGVGIPDASGDSIYNGADDDASGTSVLMAAARAFNRLDTPPRSVVFLAVSGEEKGLKGSEYFSENPTVPLEGILMNINLDMVGRNHPDTLVGIGREYTTLGPLSDAIVARHPDLGLTVIEDPEPEEQSFFRSDHLNFVNKDIPAIFFTTSDHADYHKPSDSVEKIDGEKAARIARLVFYLGYEVASGAHDPVWVPGALDEVRQIIADGITGG